MNKTQMDNLRYIHDTCKGVVPSSEWTTGSGRWTSRRAVPPCCERLDMQKACCLPGEVGARARRLHRIRPGLRFVVAITNLRGARRALRQQEG